MISGYYGYYIVLYESEFRLRIVDDVVIRFIIINDIDYSLI